MQIENSGAGQAAALGLTATGRPLTTAGLAAAQAAARRAVEAIERQARMWSRRPRSLPERRQPQVAICCSPSSLWS
jgi:hypothetical protein